jgi:hypothetical protein
MYTDSTPHEWGKPIVRPDVLDWAASAEPLTLQTARIIAHRVNVSPSLALAIAELATIVREARNG